MKTPRLFPTVILAVLLATLVATSPATGASAEEDFTVTIGQDKIFTTCNVHETEFTRGSPMPGQGEPSISVATSAGQQASAHILAEAYETGQAWAWAGVIFPVDKSPTGPDTMEADISITLRYKLKVNFDVPPPSEGGGGSAVAEVSGFIAGYHTTVDRIHFVHYSDSDEKSGKVTLKRRFSFAVGDTYEVLAEVFAHGEAIIGGPADSYSEVVVEEIRVTFEENQPPVASFRLLEERDGQVQVLHNPMVGKKIILDASDSSDPDGEVVEYEWDFGDETTATASVPEYSHVYQSPGQYTITLTVTDNHGLQDSTDPVELDLTLKNGDLLLWRSKGSPVCGFWTHVGMYHAPSNTVIEARGPWYWAVASHPLSDWLYPEQTCVQALRVSTDQPTRNRAVNFALSKVGQRYDLESLIGDGKQSDGSGWYCSELVWAAYLNASDDQIDLDPDSWLVSPDEISLSGHTEFLAQHREETPDNRCLWFLWGTSHSPVDLEITDPDGLILNKQENEIPGAIYQEVDIDEDGELDDVFAIPEPKTGSYLIQVVPEPDALPEDTYSLEVEAYGEATVLAENVQVADIPSEPYVFHSTVPAAVGGIAQLPDVSGSSGRNDVALAGLAAAALVTLGAGAWYARRRWLR